MNAAGDWIGEAVVCNPPCHRLNTALGHSCRVEYELGEGWIGTVN
jgi:hypothetical protein